MGGVRPNRDPKQKILIFDATPIMYLCKAGLGGKIQDLAPFFKLLTTTPVYEEVHLRGVHKGVKELVALRELFDRNIIEVKRPKETQKRVGDLSRSAGIHPGEASVISYALDLGGTVIIDDKRGRDIARVLGISLSGTPGIVIELVKEGIISKQDAKLALEKMIEEGWYCSAKVYSTIISMIEES